MVPRPWTNRSRHSVGNWLVKDATGTVVVASRVERQIFPLILVQGQERIRDQSIKADAPLSHLPRHSVDMIAALPQEAVDVEWIVLETAPTGTFCMGLIIHVVCDAIRI